MPNDNLPGRARIAFDPAELKYDLGDDHPFQSRRISALVDLLESSGLWEDKNGSARFPFRAATTEELSLVHTPDYIAAVQQLSVASDSATNALGAEKRQELERLALSYGFGEGDTPAIAGMHEAAALICGGTLTALSAIMGLAEGGTFATEEERPLHIFHLAGGLHHAWSNRASGFCVYNDMAVAIAHVLRATEAKILYLDFDAHHGDGVQRAFYDEPRVMTISFHETGRYLFPGTGDVLEMGKGLGRGYAVNVPLAPFTEDDSYIEIMHSLLSPLVLSFAPDVIVSQHGCDSHAWDPLTHLSLTMRGIQAAVKATHQLVHNYCHGRWLALGGGGYDLFRVVPRAWSMLWAEMSEQAIPAALPDAWIKRWYPAWQAAQQQEEVEKQIMGRAAVSGEAHFPTTFEDRAEDFPIQPRRWEINNTNRRTCALVRHLLVAPPVRQAFPTPRRISPMADIFDLLHLRGSDTPSRSKTYATTKGPLLLRDFCPPSLIERLRPDSGLRAFTRLPEREQQLLLAIAKSADCSLTIAHTPAGEIVGEVTLAPGDEWFAGVENAYEITIEVSSNWRGVGLAREMLAFALELDALEEMILFAMGLSWHWDTEDLHISVHRYRQLIAHLFGTQGFVEYPTNEPNISMEPGNILLARIGKRVDEHVARRFLNLLLSSPRTTRY